MKKTLVTMAFAAALAAPGLPATAVGPPCVDRPCVKIMCDVEGCDCIWFDVAGQRIGPIC